MLDELISKKNEYMSVYNSYKKALQSYNEFLSVYKRKKESIPIYYLMLADIDKTKKKEIIFLPLVGISVFVNILWAIPLLIDIFILVSLSKRKKKINNQINSIKELSVIHDKMYNELNEIRDRHFELKRELDTLEASLTNDEYTEYINAINDYQVLLNVLNPCDNNELKIEKK